MVIGKDDIGKETSMDTTSNNNIPAYVKELAELYNDPKLTIESLEDLCERGKEIETFKQREVFSSDRTKMEWQPIALSEVLGFCEYVNNESYNFVYEGNHDVLLKKLSDEDSDELRLFKIKYNEAINRHVKDQKIIGCPNEMKKEWEEDVLYDTSALWGKNQIIVFPLVDIDKLLHGFCMENDHGDWYYK